MVKQDRLITILIRGTTYNKRTGFDHDPPQLPDDQLIHVSGDLPRSAAKQRSRTKMCNLVIGFLRAQRIQ